MTDTQYLLLKEKVDKQERYILELTNIVSQLNNRVYVLEKDLEYYTKGYRLAKGV